MRTILSAALLVTLACSADTLDVTDGDVTKAGDGKFDSSAEAVFVDMEFDGQVIGSSAFGAERKIQDQLLYTIGHLNGDRSVGRLDQLELTNIDTEPHADGTLISYHARLPVAWGDKVNVPSSYTFRLPRNITISGQNAFTDKYKDSCVDFGAHDVDRGSMWYYYRTERGGCDLEDADIVTLDASVTLSTVNTTGKFPEYDKVWEDDVLEVVAVFGKYEDGATSNGDAGIAAYNSFVRRIKSDLSGHALETIPASVPSSPGVDSPDIELSATLPDGKRVHVVALLIDGVRTAPPSFDARYNSLSGRADVIAYNGHAGLGANIRALARKGSWLAGQYVIIFVNGCDTYAYVDDAIIDAHRILNADDPIGTRYVDMVTNALPAFFHSTAGATLAIIRGLLEYDEPITYEKIFTSIDRAQVVLVSGEQDNQFVPGGGGGGGENWAGMSESGNVLRNQETRFETPTLVAGRYVFEMTGTRDADLYVRVGTAPTTGLFDCRPFKASSNEICSVDLAAPATIHVMVRGWSSSSSWSLVGARE